MLKKMTRGDGEVGRGGGGWMTGIWKGLRSNVPVAPASLQPGSGGFPIIKRNLNFG